MSVKTFFLNFNSHQRLQQVRMVNPNVMQGSQNSQRMASPQNRPNMPSIMQNVQQPINPNIQGIQPSISGQTMIGQQQNPPPPPYPEPPPPYPGQAQVKLFFSNFFRILCEFYLLSISKNNFSNTHKNINESLFFDF